MSHFTVYALETESFFLLLIVSILVGDLLNGITHCFCKAFDDDNNEKYSLKILVCFFPEKNILSFLFLKLLHKNDYSFNFSASYLITTFLSFMVTFLCTFTFQSPLPILASLFFSYILVLLFMIDAKTQYLPDILTKPLILLGITQGYFNLFTSLKASLIGAAMGYGIFWSINALFKLIRKKEGMGGGDFKLLSAIGAWAGYANLPLVIMLSSFIAVIGAIITAPLIEKKISQPLPYGPYLAISGLVALCFGQDIIHWYMQLVGLQL